MLVTMTLNTYQILTVTLGSLSSQIFFGLTINTGIAITLVRTTTEISPATFGMGGGTANVVQPYKLRGDVPGGKSEIRPIVTVKRSKTTAGAWGLFVEEPQRSMVDNWPCLL